MTGTTGFSSGGLPIVLENLIGIFVVMGLKPEILHRLVTISLGTFDAMPHSGAIVTALVVSEPIAKPIATYGETASQTPTVSTATEEQSATMEEIAASSQALAKMDEKLTKAVSKFRT